MGFCRRQRVRRRVCSENVDISSGELVRRNAAFAATGAFAGLADPYAAVRVDTTIARHALPPSRLVSGLVYYVRTGLIEIVDPAAQE
jgi:hypothetical protein